MYIFLVTLFIYKLLQCDLKLYTVYTRCNNLPIHRVNFILYMYNSNLLQFSPFEFSNTHLVDFTITIVTYYPKT